MRKLWDNLYVHITLEEIVYRVLGKQFHEPEMIPLEIPPTVEFFIA